MADELSSSGSPAARPYFALGPMLRGPGIASDARKIILAVIGILLVRVGWTAIELAFGNPTPATKEFDLKVPYPYVSITESFTDLAWGVTEPARQVVSPFLELFRSSAKPSQWLEAAAKGLWVLAVWGLLGGAIARIAVIQAACGRRTGVATAFRFAVRKAGSLIGAPLIPFLAVICFVAVNALIGAISRIPGGVGATLGSVLWFIPVLLSIALALILIGLAAGWPLMHATIAAEDEDAPDALSRSYSYVNQRFSTYAIHVGLGWLIGIGGLFLAIQFIQLVLHLAGWSVGLGASATPEVTSLSQSIRSGWDSLVGLILQGWIYSYFWSATSLVYLILRRDVDGTEWDEVALPEHANDTFAGVVPPLVPATETSGA